MTLEAVGLTSLEARLYEALLDGELRGVAELSAALGIGEARVRQTLRGLEEKGLVTRAPGKAPRFAPAAPEVAIESLVLRRMAQLEDVRGEAHRLGQRYRQASGRSADSFVEVVTGYEATLAWAMQVQRAARTEVRLIDVPPYVLPPGPANPAELEMLARGVKYRVLYHVTSFDSPGKRNAAQECMAAGEEARIYAGTPIKMIIADDALAFAYDTNTEPIQDSVIVHRSFLLDQLRVLFDLLWSRAAGLSPTNIHPPEGKRQGLHVEPLDREILALLAAGAKDETISRQLELGLRTVRRRVAALMDLLGATTRFQAGVLAAKAEIL